MRGPGSWQISYDLGRDALDKRKTRTARVRWAAPLHCWPEFRNHCQTREDLEEQQHAKAKLGSPTTCCMKAMGKP